MKKSRKSDAIDEAGTNEDNICSNTKKLRIGNDEIDSHWKHIPSPNSLENNANIVSGDEKNISGANNNYVYVNSILKEMHMYRQIRQSTIQNPVPNRNLSKAPNSARRVSHLNRYGAQFNNSDILTRSYREYLHSSGPMSTVSSAHNGVATDCSNNATTDCACEESPSKMNISVSEE